MPQYCGWVEASVKEEAIEATATCDVLVQKMKTIDLEWICDCAVVFFIPWRSTRATPNGGKCEGSHHIIRRHIIYCKISMMILYILTSCLYWNLLCTVTLISIDSNTSAIIWWPLSKIYINFELTCWPTLVCIAFHTACKTFILQVHCCNLTFGSFKQFDLYFLMRWPPNLVACMSSVVVVESVHCDFYTYWTR